jgi:hypothetical protein
VFSHSLHCQGYLCKQYTFIIVPPSNTAQTITSTPTVVSTTFAPVITVKETTTETATVCSSTHHARNFFMQKRSTVLDADVIDESEDLEGLTNAERLRNGLPLGKPVVRRVQNSPRHFASCHPVHVTSTVTSFTKTETIQPTHFSTTKQCAFTETLDYIGQCHHDEGLAVADGFSSRHNYGYGYQNQKGHPGTFLF